MLLIVHAGLHKTASTHFQHLLLLNLDTLKRHGVYAYPDTQLLAHHGSAWMALRGNYRHVQAHITQARRLGLKTVLLSSEDFEGLIFAPAQAAALEAAAREAGATEIEWHFCLRDPGEYLLSLSSELTKHGIIDFTALAMGALRDGRYRVARETRRLPEAWEFCFDAGTFLPAFATGIGGQVVLHDFRDALPFPMHRLYARLAGGEPPVLPKGGARNLRLAAPQRAAELTRFVEAAVASTGLESQVIQLVERLDAPAELREACAAALSHKYAPGTERVLAHGVGRP